MNAPADSARGPGRLLWLASYPKSGNTWLRLFLANLTATDGPVRINSLERRPMAASRDVFEDAIGLDSSELTRDEITILRRAVYRWISSDAADVVTCKIHDACMPAPDGALIIEPEATRGVLHIVRNPLDVAVSFQHHLGLTLDEVIERMADDTFTIGGSNRPQLPQRVGSWSAHVQSWLDLAARVPVCTVRYEDLAAPDPLPVFQRIARFTGHPGDEDTVRRAVAWSAFDEARRQEDAEGFVERPAGAERFFRRGQPGSWRDEMSEVQAARLVDRHHALMRRFDYLDGRDVPPA